MGRVTLVARAILALGVWLAALGQPVVAADSQAADFGPASATPTFGEGIAFRQEVVLTTAPQRVELEISSPGQSGAFVIEVEPPTAETRTTLRYDYDLQTDGHLLPNTRLSARWLLTFGDGDADVEASEPVSVHYRDTRFDWRTRAGDIVRVHWYEGSDEFGRRALEVGERAVRETAELLGVDERDPIDFFVYADEGSFRDALGPGTRENVGGQANAEIRTLFALIRPVEIDDPWVEIVIPHELVHLVFDTAVDNPYHFPPRWLNEGLAVYLSQGYDDTDRAAVEDAASSGELMPLDALSGQFPTTFERFSLAYAESVSAVEFIVREHDRDALVGLIRSYAEGLTDDEAFQRAIGLTVAELDAAWREDLGATEPVVHGPRPAPAGPLPPGWEGSPGPIVVSPTSAASPGPSATPPASGVRANDGGGGGPFGLLGVLAIGLAGVALGLFLARRRVGGAG
jgi:hypothetical protein